MKWKEKPDIFLNFFHLVQNVERSVMIFLSIGDCFHSLGLTPAKDLFSTQRTSFQPHIVILSFKKYSLHHMPR